MNFSGAGAGADYYLLRRADAHVLSVKIPGVGAAAAATRRAVVAIPRHSLAMDFARRIKDPAQLSLTAYISENLLSRISNIQRIYYQRLRNAESALMVAQDARLHIEPVAERLTVAQMMTVSPVPLNQLMLLPYLQNISVCLVEDMLDENTAAVNVLEADTNLDDFARGGFNKIRA